jgi:hypothetical protein
LFTDYFLKLNKYGLFPSPKEVQLFVDYYLSFDWTEHDDYEIAEIFIDNSFNCFRNNLLIKWQTYRSRFTGMGKKQA